MYVWGERSPHTFTHEYGIVGMLERITERVSLSARMIALLEMERISLDTKFTKQRLITETFCKLFCMDDSYKFIVWDELQHHMVNIEKYCRLRLVLAEIIDQSDYSVAARVDRMAFDLYASIHHDMKISANREYHKQHDN